MPPKKRAANKSPEGSVRKAPARSAKTRSAASTSSMYKEAAAYVESSSDDHISEEEEEILSEGDLDEDEFEDAVKPRSGKAQRPKKTGGGSSGGSSTGSKGGGAMGRRSSTADTGRGRSQRSASIQTPTFNPPSTGSTAGRRVAATSTPARAVVSPSSRANSASTATKRKASNIKFLPLSTTPVPSPTPSSSSSSSARPAAASVNGPDPRQKDDQWSEKYAPLHTADVAVHKGKVANVREWLELYTGPRSGQQGGAILVLTGPAGSGKTAVLRALAQEMGIRIMEWINTVNENNIIQRPTMPGQVPWRSDSVDEEYIPVMNAFQEFFSRAHRFSPLITTRDVTRQEQDQGVSTTNYAAVGPSPTNTRKNIILIEDLPPVSAYSSRMIFQETISRFANSRASSSSVLVIIVSDVFSKQSTELLFSSSSETRDPALTLRNLLPPTVLSRIDSGGKDCGRIKQISFNPIAPTFVKKALRKMVEKEFRTGGAHAPDSAELDQLIEIHDGDIRAVINALQFMCYISSAKRRRYREAALRLEEEQEGLVDTENKTVQGQDSSLGLFHAVAKVLYNKREWSAPPVEFDRDIVKVPAQAWSKRRPPMLFNPEKDLIEKLPIEPDLYTLMLHQNYTRHLSNIDECLTAMEYLCVADQMSHSSSTGTSSYTQMAQMQPYMTTLAVRGLLFAPTSAGPTSSFGGSGQRKHWWPETFAMNRIKRSNDAMFTQVAADLAGEEAQGLSSGHVTGPGFIPKVVIREELVPMLHKCACMNPYLAILNQSLRPSSKAFVRTAVGNYGRKIGMAKKEFGEGDEGFMEEVVPSAAEGVSGNGADEIVSDLGGTSAGSRIEQVLGQRGDSIRRQQQQQQHTYSQMAHEIEEDPIEDFSD
ncbi:Cell cycle checkpoint protein rad17 [Mortierella sp. GBA30]|nr:Cell cycle checkpoint protein rad17 [Mortierella sp. GBA30]